MLFTGMGADHRLFKEIEVPGVDLVTPDHIDPLPGESLSAYALRFAREMAITPDDVIGGASFGGMIAAEIAARMPVSGLVLLGSCVRPERLPFTYRMMRGLLPILPPSFLRLRIWRPLVRWRFSPLSPTAEAVLFEMMRTFPSRKLKEFCRMVLQWPGAKPIGIPVLSVHGSRDRMLPPPCAEPGLFFTDAGHAFTLTHSNETNAALTEFVRGERNAKTL